MFRIRLGRSPVNYLLRAMWHISPRTAGGGVEYFTKGRDIWDKEIGVAIIWEGEFGAKVTKQNVYSSIYVFSLDSLIGNTSKIETRNFCDHWPLNSSLFTDPLFCLEFVKFASLAKY